MSVRRYRTLPAKAESTADLQGLARHKARFSTRQIGNAMCDVQRSAAAFDALLGQQRIGEERICACFFVIDMRKTCSVPMSPGIMTLTVIPDAPASQASTWSHACGSFT
jgi:hypothetical protein